MAWRRCMQGHYGTRGMAAACARAPLPLTLTLAPPSRHPLASHLTFIQSPDGLRRQASNSPQHSSQHAAVAAVLQALGAVARREHHASTAAAAGRRRCCRAAASHNLRLPALQAAAEGAAGARPADVLRVGQAVEPHGCDCLASGGGPLGGGVGKGKHHVLCQAMSREAAQGCR